MIGLDTRLVLEATEPSFCTSPSPPTLPTEAQVSWLATTSSQVSKDLTLSLPGGPKYKMKYIFLKYKYKTALPRLNKVVGLY